MFIGTVDGPYRYNKVLHIYLLTMLWAILQFEQLQSTKQIVVTTNSGELCLTVNPEPGSTDLIMVQCDESNKYQTWKWTEKYS